MQNFTRVPDSLEASLNAFYQSNPQAAQTQPTTTIPVQAQTVGKPQPPTQPPTKQTKRSQSQQEEPKQESELTEAQLMRDAIRQDQRNAIAILAPSFFSWGVPFAATAVLTPVAALVITGLASKALYVYLIALTGAGAIGGSAILGFKTGNARLVILSLHLVIASAIAVLIALACLSAIAFIPKA